MSGEPKTLTPEQEKAAREAFETRYKAFAWWTERYGTQHPALHKDENGDYLEEGQRKYWTGFQEGYAAALDVPVVARDEAAEPKSIGWDDVTEEHVVGAFLDAQAEAHRYRNALEALLNSSHRGIYDAAWALEAVANAEALISPGLDDDYRKAKAREAYERRLAGGENER